LQLDVAKVGYPHRLRNYLRFKSVLADTLTRGAAVGFTAFRS
jgi:hypothetical protein